MSADFVPLRRVVTAITNGDPAVVTATAHGYATDEVVRVNVPLKYRMRLPEDEYTISVINANTFSINFDTSSLDAFVIPGGNITAISQASSAVVTAAGHNIVLGDIVNIADVEGMTEINGGPYNVTLVAVDDITVDVDSTGFTAYTTAGTIRDAETPAEVLPISEETDNIA